MYATQTIRSSHSIEENSCLKGTKHQNPITCSFYFELIIYRRINHLNGLLATLCCDSQCVIQLDMSQITQRILFKFWWHI